MKIFHICSYYIGSKVYQSIFQKYSSNENISDQFVYVPIRKPSQEDANSLDNNKISLCYEKCLNPLTRVFFFYKLIALFKCLCRVLKKNPEICNFDIIHAHTLYSDGFLAYFAHRKLNIPYVITVRTTDVSLYEKFAPHWRMMARKVLKNAQCVVFMSSGHMRLIERKYKKHLPKTVVIPNGVDQFWIENSILSKLNQSMNGRSAVYLGAINKNKNIKKAITAFFSVRSGSEDRFYVIGGTSEDFRSVYGSLPEEELARTVFVKKTDNRELLKDYLLNSDLLIMPSYMETFGLVYLEAISQCTPVVLSADRGIDGLFESGSIGYACDPSDLESIKSAVWQTLKRFPNGLNFELCGKNPVEDFSWDAVTSRYLKEVY